MDEKLNGPTGIDPEDKNLLVNQEIESVDVAEELDLMGEDDLDVKNYIKISPTLYIQVVEPEVEEGVELTEEDLDNYKVFNPETGVVETRKLTDEEKKEIFVLELKRARIKFRNTTHDGNVTKTQFGSNYKQKRKKKNTLRKKSRKANR